MNARSPLTDSQHLHPSIAWEDSHGRNHTMTSDRNKLSLGNRRTPRPKRTFIENANSTVKTVKGPRINENLDQLLALDTPEGYNPVVRLKSTDATYNAAGDRVVLIRRNPFAEQSEYEPAITYAGEQSLRQWVSAGVSQHYPEEHRSFAERDLIRAINERSRQDNKASRNAWSKFVAANTHFQEEIEPTCEPDSKEYLKALWAIRTLERDVDMLHEAAAMDRLARITHAIQDELIITPEGLQSARAAQLLALIDSLPLKQGNRIPPELKSELAVAITNLTPTSKLMVGKLLETDIDWHAAEQAETLFTWKRIMWTATKLVENL